MEENTPSIRELFSQFRNVHANQGIRPVTNALNINNNNNNTTTNQHSNNNNNGYEIHNHPNQQAMPSTSTSTSPPASASRSISPRLMMLVNQFQNASVSNMLPNRTQIIEYTKKVQPEMRVHVQMATKFHGVDKSKIGIYPMKSKKRGILIIVNNIHFDNRPRLRRNGAETDRDNIVNVFRQMGFFVCVQENLTKFEFLTFLENIIGDKEIGTFDCFIFAIFSHGEQTEVQFVDGGKVEVEDILTKFNNFHCPSLVGKPKIFLFPFCRGPLSDHGVTRRTTESETAGAYANIQGDVNNAPSQMYYEMKIRYSGTPSTREESCRARPSNFELARMRTESDSSGKGPMGLNIATFFDMKVCYSTVLGYNAFRDPLEGSWYVQILCKVLAEHAHDTHLEDLLKIIGEQMNFKRTENDLLQTISNEDRGFTKHLYFNPGFYSDEQ